MRKFIKPHFIIGLLLLCFSCVTIQAQIQQEFQPRFNQTVNGDVTVIANNVLSRTATGNYNGSDGNHSFSNNVYVDIDDDITTFNSSSANFSNPSPSLVCLSVIRAYLYWAAADKEPTEDLNSDNQPDWDYNQVKLKLPNQTDYSTITADNVIFRGRDFHFSNDPYICFKDITDEVLALDNAYGTYQVANVEAKEGSLMSHMGNNTGTSGGWQIVFVYESPKLPAKNVSLFDGYAHVTADDNDFDISFNGFQTVPTGDVDANVIIGALEGDRDLSGDQLKIRDTNNNFIPISSNNRSANNFFNSRITSGNSNFLDRNPASTNTLGFDSAIFALDNEDNEIIGNNQTSATLRLDSNQETFGLYLLGFSVDVWAPNFNPIELLMNSGVTTADAGDTLGFSFNVLNRGNDDAIDLTVTTTLPAMVSNVNAPDLPDGVIYNFNATTGELTFNIEDDLVEIGEPEFDVEFEFELQDECFFLEENCDLTFDLQFTATYNGVQNPNEQTAVSSSGLDACNLGNLQPLTVNINQPTVAWATQSGALNVTLDCDNLDGLDDAQNLVPVTDNCNFTLIKTSGEFVPNPTGCGTNDGSYTNTWTFTDACDVTIDAFVQTITIQDTTAPNFNEVLPADATLECDAIPEAVILTASDNCAVDVTVIFNETQNNTATCPTLYTIVRTWSATDVCDNTITHTQTITVQDTTAPTFNEALPADVTVECDAIPEAVILTANDNCGDVTVSFEETQNNTATCPTLYTVVRTWSVTDACDNTTIHAQTITVQDTTAPTFNETLPGDVTVECDAIPEAVTLTATDNCADDVTVTFNETQNNTATCPTLYTVVRTWSVTDACDNTTIHTQTITVQDTTAPTFNETLRGDVTVECDAIPEAVTLTATDNCADDVTVTFNETQNNTATCPTLYTVVRTWSVTDACDNTTIHTQTITVQDTTAPTFNETLPGDVTVECDAIPEAATLTATDNCADDVTVTFNETQNNTATCPTLYTVVRTWSVTDACDNTTTHTQTITVQDTTAPTFNEALPADVTVECDAIPEAVTLTANDNCGDVTVSFEETQNNTATCPTLFTITRTWSVTDACDNTTTHTQTITVQDTTAPTFNEALPADVTVECDAIPEAVTLTANDNCGDVTVSFEETQNNTATCPTLFTITRTWSVTDACDNTTIHTQIITVQDTTAPTFNETLPADITAECGDVPAAETLTASDSCAGDVIVTFNELDNSTDACNQAIVRTWTVTDTCGNTATHTQTISIQDNTAPVITTEASNVAIECDGSGNNSAIEDWLNTNGGATATDNCNTITWTNNYNGATSDCSAPVEVIFTATDVCGNTSTTSATYAIEDNNAPTIETEAQNVTIECNDTIETALQDWLASNGGASATDDCSSVTWSNDFNELSDDCGATGTATVTFTAMDGCGNSSTTTATFTVEDTTAPSFNETLPIDITVECDAIPGAVTLTANDTCSAANVNFEETQTDGTCPTFSVITRTWTASDDCGNTTTQTQVITVEDTTAPAFNEALPADLTVECDAIPDADTLTASDNCGTVTVLFEEVQNDAAACPTLYTIFRTWSVTDACDNTTTHTQTISVQDTTAPDFNETLPADISAECDEIPEAVTLTASDNCAGDISVTFTEEDNSTDACNQSIVRTWTATDDCGNSTTHIQTITIEDNIAPLITIEATNIEIECSDADSGDAITNWLNTNGGATATDNCSAVTWTNNYDGTTSDCAIPIEVTFTATDACGNMSTTTATYAIQDTVAPTIDMEAQDVAIECGGAIEDALQDWLSTIGGATATDDCSSITWSNNFSGFSDDCGETGFATVTFTATDSCGNTSTTSATFTIEDTLAPTFNEDLPMDATVECDTIPEAVTLTASDFCSATNVTFEETQTDGTCPILSVITRTWVATDACENTTTHIQTITVQDTAAPMFNEGLPADITAECGDVPDAVALTASDNCGDVTVTFNEADNSTDACNQAIVRTWIATDTCGNSTTHIQTITIQDNTAPTFNEDLPADFSADCDTVPEAETLTASDNCSGVTVTFNEQDNSAGGCNSASIIRTWTATDACGNTATHIQTITIQDTTPPTFNEELPSDITLDCGDIPDAVTLTASDSCSDATVTFNEVDNSTDACNISIIRTWTAIDICNNSVTHVQTITIQDNTAPTFTVPADVNLSCDEDITDMSLTGDVTDESDNCSVDLDASFTDTVSTSDCSTVITRDWILLDDCGNTATGQQIITLADTNPPVVLGSFDPVISVNCDAIPDTPNLVFEDDCSNITVNGPNETIDNVTDNSYSIIRTWIVTDDCGNANTYTQTVNVTENASTLQFNDALCIDDLSKDLFDILPQGTPTDGTWSTTIGTATLDGSIFDPFEVSLGDYQFTYTTSPTDACPINYIVDMNVNDACLVLGCNDAENIIISKAVTPNGDMHNENFEITGIENCGFTLKIQLFNRWGALIYKSDDYQNNWNGFNSKGSIGSSNKVPTGTYYYIVELEGSGLKPLTGPIYVGTK